MTDWQVLILQAWCLILILGIPAMLIYAFVAG